jgi:hypothetical protein
MTTMSASITNPWVPQIADMSAPDLGAGGAQVYEYAIDGGTGTFRGFSAFVQIASPLGIEPRVEGFLARYRHPENTQEFRLTKRDVERIEVYTAQELQIDGAGSPCTAIVIHLRPNHLNTIVSKIVIYPENELAELAGSKDAPIGRIYGYYDEVPPYRFNRTSNTRAA